LRIGSFPLHWIKLVGERDGKRKLESRTETAEQIQPLRSGRAHRSKSILELGSTRMYLIVTTVQKSAAQLHLENITLCIFVAGDKYSRPSGGI